MVKQYIEEQFIWNGLFFYKGFVFEFLFIISCLDLYLTYKNNEIQ